MAYDGSIGGRFAEDTSGDGRIAISFDWVEARLLEAWGFLRRLPDREAGWTRIRAFWPEVRRHTWFGDYGDMEADAPRSLPGLRTAEVERMDEALGWVEWVDPRERKLIALVMQQLDREQVSRPAWIELADDWRRAGGDAVLSDTLRMRYNRAITAIAVKLDKAQTRGNACV